MWHISIPRFSAIKNELMSFAGKWMEQDVIMLSEISNESGAERSSSCFLSCVEARSLKKEGSLIIGSAFQ
jgi:hypothetical protein